MKKALEIAANIITAAALILLMVSVSALDSTSWTPFIGCLVSLLWLAPAAYFHR